MLAETQSADQRPQALSGAMRPSVEELVAWQAVGWPFTTLILAKILFWVGIPIGPYHLWAALLLLLTVGGRLAGDWRTWLMATLWLGACTLVGGAVLGWLYDLSGDGQWYHLPGILALSQGWNPFHATRLAELNPGFEQAIAGSDFHYPAYVYVQHYAKGAWGRTFDTYLEPIGIFLITTSR